MSGVVAVLHVFPLRERFDRYKQLLRVCVVFRRVLPWFENGSQVIHVEDMYVPREALDSYDRHRASAMRHRRHASLVWSIEQYGATLLTTAAIIWKRF